MDLWPLVLRDGDAVTASGRVVATPQGTWFQPLLPVAPIAYAVPPPIEPSHPFAVPVEGVDVDALEPRTERDGRVAALAELRGTWRAGRIVVTRQGPERPRPREELIAEALGTDVPRLTVPVPEQVREDMRTTLDAHAEQWQAWMWSPGDDGEVPTRGLVELVRVHVSLAEWAEALPDDVLQVRAWLVPER